MLIDSIERQRDRQIDKRRKTYNERIYKQKDVKKEVENNREGINREG